VKEKSNEINEPETGKEASQTTHPTEEEKTLKLDEFKSAYHCLVNNSKKLHSVSRDIEIKVVSSGHLLGVEDAVLNNSNRKINNFTYSSV